MRIPDASERKVLLLCGALAGLLCTAPGDVFAAALLWVVTLTGYAIHKRLLKSERALASKA